MNLYTIQYNLLKKYFQVEKNQWSILITTSHTLNILDQIIDNIILKERYITSIHQLDDPRSPIKIAHAIYFIDSSDESMNILYNDLKNDYYASYSLYFLTTISWHSLEKLAEYNCIKIMQIFDLFFDFTVLNRDFFSTEIKFSNDLSYLNRMSESLFSLFFSLGTQPHIIFEKEWKYEKELAKILEEKFRRRAIVKKSSTSPLLIFYERERDILQPLFHSFSYEGLLFELFGRTNSFSIDDQQIKLNRNDFFWESSNLFIEDAAKEIEGLFKNYKQKIQSKKLDNIQLIESTVQNHMKLSLKVIEKINARKLDLFYRLENMKLKEEDLTEIEEGEHDDVKSFLILKLLTENLNKEMIEKIRDIAEKRSIDLKILEHFEKFVQQKSLVLNRFKEAVSGVVGKISGFLQQTFNTPLSNYVYEKYSEREEEIPFIVVYAINGGTFNEKKSLNMLSEKIGIPIIYGVNEIISRADYLQ